MDGQRKTPTIQDVARFARVSTATVSRALSAPGRVSQETRARISEAITATGYTLNQAARSLRQKSARTILVALPDIRNAFFSSILDAVEREADRRGYGVLIANLYIGDETTRRLRDYMLSNRADGLLLFDGSVDPGTLHALTAMPNAVPLVVACEDIPNSGFHTVVTDNVEAAIGATNHLLGLGHRRIGHIIGPPHNPVARDRLLGFERALAAAGIPLNSDWLFPAGFDIAGGLSAASSFLALRDRPTAVFATNDESAIGFLSGLRHEGIVCPRDISIVGFDDLSVAAHYVPPLTTIRQPREELGRIAAGTLFDCIEGLRPKSPAGRIVLTSSLIVRDSAAPVPRAPG